MLHGRVVVKGTMPDGAADCELKYDHDPSGQKVGTVVGSEDAEDGMRARIKAADEYLASDLDLSSIVDHAVKSPYDVVVKEDEDVGEKN